MNRDGKPDLIVANFNANTVSVLLGIGNGTFAAKTDLSTGAGPFSVAIADLNGDGKPDLVVADVNANALTVFVNSTRRGPAWSGGHDHDGDGKADVAVYRGSTGQWFILNSGGGSTTIAWGAPALGDAPLTEPAALR